MSQQRNVGVKLWYFLTGALIGSLVTSTYLFALKNLPNPTNQHYNYNAGFYETTSRQSVDIVKTNGRLLRAVFGTSINEVVFTVLRGLAVSHPALAPEVQSLENTLVHFAEKAIQCIQSTIHVDYAMSLLSEPAPPTIVLRSATYGPKDPQRLPLSRADVTWILQSYIYDSLLRIPTGFHVYNLFGSVLQGQDDSIHHTLVIEAQVGNGDLVNASVEIIQGVVQSDLILSSTQPSEIVSLSIEVVNEAIFLATTGKNGLEIGGPSSHLQ
jgi:hypothetical protein